MSSSNIIDADTVRKVADLAQLEMSEEEIDILLPRIQEFMGFVEIIKGVDLDTTPTVGVKGAAEQLLRPDFQIDFDNSDNIIKNFPEQEQGYLNVPRVAAEEP
eukprot:CAMPEP_0182428608 /NCGR_PEP_ID=MMETSP1167-20130531/23150_1 /TAXON_ID=2988 /ORGANISM="Mallomonas Sp, Strain CCMP3275" /LENGTH=102 /DNA_ID=CAMNT_0024611597 /DNA_START=91 /DNA_END=399 /DNA_ORIENTATION=+